MTEFAKRQKPTVGLGYANNVDAEYLFANKMLWKELK